MGAARSMASTRAAHRMRMGGRAMTRALVIALTLLALALTGRPGADQPATSPDPMTYGARP